MSVLRPADVDVLVVGAGVSGVVVARDMHQRGASVVVLESRDRIGGRLHSFESMHGASLDLGASWFWPGERRVAALIDGLGIRTHPHALDGDALYHVPPARPGGPSGSQRLDGNPIDVVSGRFTDGADSLVRGVAATLPDETIRLRHAVDLIVARADGRLIVRADATEFVAEHVVLALPPALAVHRITFDPPLPDDLLRVASSTPVWMGAIAKVVVTFDRPFWRERGLSGSAISHVGPMRELHDMSGPGGTPAAIFGFAPVPAGGDAPAREQIDEQLDALFGVDRPPATEIVIESWAHRPDTSPPDAARLGDHSTFGHPIFHTPTVGGRLHWSSTETASDAPGHIEGALQAAERTVRTLAAAGTIRAPNTSAPRPDRPDQPTHVRTR